MSKIELVKVSNDKYDVVGFENSQVIQKVWVEKPVEDFGWNVCLHFNKDGNVYFFSQHRLDLEESLDLLQDDYENEVVKFCVENDLYWGIVE